MATPASARWTGCICAGDIYVGWLVQGSINASRQIGVQCGLPSFDASGNLTGQNFCSDFILLTK
jgi:hypothetical protein